ncbi:hypothetical protein GCM10007063_05400 [Lentibacillus kapialis]|uniref:Ribbon-helix-helix protein CopG domain-containing protein n=1 Tax=Lentibacillus kapialis TaxID=340214 RepID=A0A917UUF0_9BACI|nr:CopG family transcriptional regulator [Lentibacillus kapialis]GGJ85865.1 hypothetical protein GCM10007063_05400 [Lentibacillus kapialis]
MANLNIRIDKELRDQFKETAKKNAHNSSELIRQWIEQYVKGGLK